LIGTGTELNEARWRGAVVAPEQTAAHQRTISLQSVDGRAREQASASDRTGQDIVAEAIDHVSDNTIAGDSFLRLEATYFNALGQNLIFALEPSLI
jgi:hypothetical protein